MLAINVDFITCALGGQVKVMYDRLETCKACKGTRILAASKCEKCKGTGRSLTKGKGKGRKCTSCEGTGRKPESPCDKCKGTGLQKSKFVQPINILRGTNSGNVITVKKMGQLGGDLLVKVNMSPHSLFKRKGYDIYTEVSINKELGKEGAELMVDTLYGKRAIKIPKATTKNTICKLPGHGIAHMYPNQHLKGDHLVHVTVSK